jgi:hypothetical protein
MIRILVNVSFLCGAIVLTAAGIHENNLIIMFLGGLCIGVYNFIIEKDNYKRKLLEKVELTQEQTEDGHWQDVRERAAIAAMQGLLCAPSYEADRDTLNMIATDAVSIADTLIEKLKKK